MVLEETKWDYSEPSVALVSFGVFMDMVFFLF